MRPICVHLCLIIFFLAGRGNSSLGQKDTGTVKPAGTPAVANNGAKKDFPPVLFGTLKFADPANNGQMTLTGDVETGDIGATRSRGFAVMLPDSGATSEMDVLNCNGYLGKASVKFNDVTETSLPFSAELISEKTVSDLKQKMLECMEQPVDRHFANAPVNFVFFVRTGKETPKSVAGTKPNWKDIIKSIPYEWRTASGLRQNPTPREIKERIPDWADTNGDGTVDLIRITSKGDTDRSIDFYRILYLVEGEWQQVWQTQQKEREN